MDYSANQDQQDQQRLLVAALLGANDPDQEDVAPVPTAPGTPYVPLVTTDNASLPPVATNPQPQGPPPGTHYAQGPGAPLLLNDNQDALTSGFRNYLATALRGEAPSIPSPSPAPAPSPVPAVANSAALPMPVQTAGSDDSTLAAYKSLHDQAIAEHNNMLMRGDQVRAAGGDPAPYYKLAGEATKVANDINLKAIEYAKPEALTTEIVKLADGTYQTVNKATGDPIGQPVGHPAEPAVPVTDEQRAYWHLPPTGAFTSVPGQVPQQIAGAGTATEPRLPPQAIDDLAQRYNAGDNTAVTVLGFASATDKAAVITRAAELRQQQGGAATDQLANRIALGGKMQEARTSGALGARINTFAEESNKTGDLAITASDAVPRGQWVPITAIEQMGETMHSNPQLSAFRAANLSFANTYSRMVSLSGAMTDSSRDHALAVLNVAQSPEAYRAAVTQLRQEGMAIRSAVETVRAQQQGGAVPSPAAPAAPAAPGPVRIQSDSDYNGLPSGARFIGPDGRARIKP